MKTALLKRLTRQSRNEVTIHSITKDGDGFAIGMSYGYDENCYKGLFELGDIEKGIMQKVRHIYIQRYFGWIRKKYKKYSIKNKA